MTASLRPLAPPRSRSLAREVEARLPPGERAGARPDIAGGRQIFANRNLRLDKLEMVGFDMDHTLAIYRDRHVEELSFEMTLARLVADCGYPPDIASIRYDPAFVIRGLVIDKKLGNIIKTDRHKHVGRVFHGRRRLTKEERRQAYRSEWLRLSSPRYAWVDTLFALPEACLFAFIIDLMEAQGHTVDYGRLYDDIREKIDSVHRDGSLKAEIQKNLPRYFVRDPDLAPALHKLRSAGKKVFVATNSYWEYTDAVMSYLLDGVLPEYPGWQRYFDYVIVGAQKPSFFNESAPFLQLDRSGAVRAEAARLERGAVYQGGNLADFERMTGIAGERVLYVGDHIYGDILRSKKSSLWRTCMVVKEIEEELAYTDRLSAEIGELRELEGLRARLDDEINHLKLTLASMEAGPEHGPAASPGCASLREELERLRRLQREVVDEARALQEFVSSGFNPYWGLTFKQGHENSRFGQQVEHYACLYTSRASNFLFYSPMQYFRAPRGLMAHERMAG